MNKDQKAQYIDDLAQDLSQANIVYLADTANLSVETINQLRRRCFQAGISLRVVKNTLLAKAMERVEGRNYGQLPEVLAGPTSVMFAEVGNAPAKLIQEFRKKNDKPLLKGAYIEEAIFIGDSQLEALVAIKSREELIGDIIGLLQSPAKNVISGLKGGGNKIAGLLKTLEERA
jgi:large subunit ribosomal protein L10